MSDISKPAQPNPAAPAKLKRLDRQILAITLRKQGGSYRQIRDQLRKQPGVSPSYSESNAYRDCMAGLKRLNEKMSEGAAEMRRLDLDRLDDLFAVFWPLAKKGDYAAFDRVMTILGQRAKLYGYEAVNKVELSGKLAQELSGPGGGPIAMDVVQLDAIIERVYGPLIASQSQTDAPANEGANAANADAPDDEGLED